MLDGARVVLKQHRAEIALAATAALIVGISAVAAMTVLSRETSTAAVSYIIESMRVLPFAVGLIGGVPIVSRELEERTALVAWSLSGSRSRWLARQVAPIGTLLIAAIAFPAFATAAVAVDRGRVAEQAFLDIGAHGLPAIARAFAAFGLGLFFGAFMRRALPALIVAAAVVLFLFITTTEARGRWLAVQGPVVVVDDPASVIQTGWALVGPDGTALTLEAAAQRAPASAVDAMRWLEENGYRWLGLGVPRDVAMVWSNYEALLFTLVGVVACAGAIPVVNRRRPV